MGSQQRADDDAQQQEQGLATGAPTPAPEASAALPSAPAPITAASTAAVWVADPHVLVSGSGSSSNGSSSVELGGGGGGEAALEMCLAMGADEVHAAHEAHAAHAVHAAQVQVAADAGRSYPSMTRSSIAKQLSVLFDEAPDDAPADADGKGATELSAAAERAELAFSDYSTARLADQLAALCCSPPRRDQASAGASSPTSRW